MNYFDYEKFHEIRNNGDLTKTNIQIIGLTGGIGSGKSTVLKILSDFGIPGWDADKSAHSAYRNHTELRRMVADKWGENLLIYNNAGKDVDIDRTALSKIVFQDHKSMNVLYEFIQPFIAKDFANWIVKQSQRVYPPSWVVMESAILFESGAYRNCTITLNIEAPESERIDRVIRRDGKSRESVRARIRHQLSDKQRSELADFTIYNGNSDELMTQIENFLNKLD